MNCAEQSSSRIRLDEEIRQLAERVAAVDPMAFEAFIATAAAMVAGRDDETALNAGNAILIKAGRKPLPVPDLLAKMKTACGNGTS